ncbi:hypothetical protein SSBG_06595 [Streptomyces sp. SPB074]|nr:hypothetical protein SSBG_06595 [Streptomyces sp. SPB074]
MQVRARPVGGGGDEGALAEEEGDGLGGGELRGRGDDVERAVRERSGGEVREGPRGVRERLLDGLGEVGPAGVRMPAREVVGEHSEGGVGDDEADRRDAAVGVVPHRVGERGGIAQRAPGRVGERGRGDPGGAEAGDEVGGLAAPAALREGEDHVRAAQDARLVGAVGARGVDTGLAQRVQR